MVMTSRTVRKVFVKVPDNITAGPTQVKVGFPAGSTNVDKAIWNEFGTRGGASGGGWGGPIPERPFMRNAMRNNQARYVGIMRSLAKRMIEGGGGNIQTLLAKLGALAAGDIQKEITALTSPPNSPVTIALKGSSKPLIDTGEMRGSVTWKIDD